MALRAGYYGLKRFEKNKLSILAASMPSDISPDNPIAGKNDIQGIYDFNAKTGVHQLLYNTAVSKTEDTVTFTVNADTTVDVITSGITTANANLKMTNPRMNSDNLPIGTYRASKKTTNANICMYVNAYNNTSYVKQLLFLDSNADGLFTVDYNGYNFIEIGLTVPTGREIPISIKVEPLVTYPEDKSNLITLPAMTNRELTETIGRELSVSGLTYTNCEYVAGGYVVSGNICTVNIRVKATADAGISINGLPNAKISNNSNYIPAIMHKVGGVITDSIPAYCTSDGLLSGFQDAVTDSNYLISASYLIRSSVLANREISPDSEVKEPTKKATKKKVIKEEEE